MLLANWRNCNWRILIRTRFKTPKLPWTVVLCPTYSGHIVASLDKFFGEVAERDVTLIRRKYLGFPGSNFADIKIKKYGSRFGGKKCINTYVGCLFTPFVNVSKEVNCLTTPYTLSPFMMLWKLSTAHRPPALLISSMLRDNAHHRTGEMGWTFDDVLNCPSSINEEAIQCLLRVPNHSTHHVPSLKETEKPIYQLSSKSRLFPTQNLLRNTSLGTCPHSETGGHLPVHVGARCHTPRLQGRLHRAHAPLLQKKGQLPNLWQPPGYITPVDTRQDP